MLDLKNISVEFQTDKDKFKALDDVNLAINEGEFVCVLGPSGCGKSTLLNVIAGLLKPTSGEAKMYGELIDGTDVNRSVVFQTPPLYPWLDIKGNVAFGLKMKGELSKDEIKEETAKYLDLVDLSDFADSKPYELSGGMKQRAQLARVLINKPSMVLMDEPFGALDALTRTKMQDLIRRIWLRTENTVFLITHDVDEALSLGTRIIVMTPRPGKITEELETDFTFQVKNGSDDYMYSDRYKKLRKEILGIISDK